MRISDWSSDVCSSDLPDDVAAVGAVIGAETALAGVVIEVAEPRAAVKRLDRIGTERAEAHRRDVEQRGSIGFRALRRARKSGVEGKSVSGRVDLGGRRIRKKKQKKKDKMQSN